MDNDLRDIILGYDRPVPRYTSYPTAPHFHPGFDARDYARWLGDVPRGKAYSLYIHVPFCPKLCWFCGCHTKITRRSAPVEDYVGLLQREIAMISASLPGRVAGHVHFGGGSPSMLDAPMFASFMEALRTAIPLADWAEIALELDPRQASEGRIATYARYGINRISLGVQDFDATVLESVNRPQSFHTVYESVRLCRDYGIDAINMDFIYGLPHQTVETMRRTMELALGFSPSRVSLFGYAHVPWMKKHMRLIPAQALPDAAQRYDIFAAGVEILEQGGYQRIGIDHFVRPGDSLHLAAQAGQLRRNFQGYTADPCETMIGAGISAIGKLPGGFVQNTPHNPHYQERIAQGVLPVEKVCVLTREDRARAEIIENLMCAFRADIPTICGRHEYDPEILRRVCESAMMTRMIADGLAAVSPEGIVQVLHPLAARLVSSIFDAYIAPEAAAPARHAAAV